MNELPYGRFYYKDWLASASVQAMTPEQRGAYFHLLAHCWNSDGLPSDFEATSRLAGIADASEIVKRHFTITINKKLWNERLLSERCELLWAKSRQSEGGKNKQLASSLEVASKQPPKQPCGNQNQIQNQKEPKKPLEAKENTPTCKSAGFPDDVIFVYDHYRDKVEPLQGNRKMSLDYIKRLMTSHGYTKEQLTNAIDSYINTFTDTQRHDRQLRCRPQNFFSPEKERYAEFINTPAKQPDKDEWHDPDL